MQKNENHVILVITFMFVQLNLAIDVCRDTITFNFISSLRSRQPV